MHNFEIVNYSSDDGSESSSDLSEGTDDSFIRLSDADSDASFTNFPSRNGAGTQCSVYDYTVHPRTPEPNTIDLMSHIYSEEEKNEITGEWKLRFPKEEEENENNLHFKFLGDALVCSEKVDGKETFMSAKNLDERFIENGKLYIVSEGVSKSYIKVAPEVEIPEASKPIQEAICGTWKVVDIENFDGYKNYRPVTKDREAMWKFGHAFYSLENDKLTRGTLINGNKWGFTTVKFDVPQRVGNRKRVTSIEGDKIITTHKAGDEEMWRITRYIENERLHVALKYSNGVLVTRVLERI